jgi:adenine phosphoribosyltransferase
MRPSEGEGPLEGRVKRLIRDIPDYPKPGIVFKDITPLLGNGPAFAAACQAMVQPFRGAGVSHVAAIESRGFLFAAPIAMDLGAGVVPVRKRGKLPYHAAAEEYDLEYGTDALEMHLDAIEEGAHVLVVDDVLATGGTASATCRLIERLGGVIVGCSFLIQLDFLHGRERLAGRHVTSLVAY